MRTDQRIAEKLRVLSKLEEQCALNAIQDVVAKGDIHDASHRARMAAEAVLAGIATLRGNDGPVVMARRGQSRRDLAIELEEVASQLRQEADDWDAELERMNKEASDYRRTDFSVHQGSAGVENPDSPEGHSPDPMQHEKPGQGGANE